MNEVLGRLHPVQTVKDLLNSWHFDANILCCISTKKMILKTGSLAQLPLYIHEDAKKWKEQTFALDVDRTTVAL